MLFEIHHQNVKGDVAEVEELDKNTSILPQPHPNEHHVKNMLVYFSGMMSYNQTTPLYTSSLHRKQFNSFPSMVPPVAPIENLYFAGENHCVLTFARLFYKCKDEYFIY